jgi:hypothetical protein
MRRELFAGLILAFLVTSVAWAQGTYTVSPAPLPSGSDLPAALAAVLQPSGSQVRDATGATVCEVWLGKAVPVKTGATSSADVMYGNLEVGTLVGAIHFPKAGSDFRGQTIKPGFYTLRYALVPQDGNHMGVNPTRDFVLMSPVAQDTQLDKALKFDDLVKISKQASGTNHPAILTMSTPGAANATSPSLLKDDQGYWELQAQGKANGGQAQSLPFTIIVVGKTLATE